MDIWSSFLGKTKTDNGRIILYVFEGNLSLVWAYADINNPIPISCRYNSGNDTSIFQLELTDNQVTNGATIYFAAIQSTDAAAILGDEFTTDSVGEMAHNIVGVDKSRTELKKHIDEDMARRKMVSDGMAAVYAAAIKKAQEIYAGTTDLDFDFNQPTVIIGANGLLSVGASGGYAVPANGAIVCTYSAVVGAVKTVQVNGATVWTSPLSLLGLGVPPSDPIRVNAGDVISSVGVLGLGESLNVTFYPNI